MSGIIQSLKKYGWMLILNMTSMPLFAQQDAQFSQYMFNTMYLNPAFAGAEGFTRFQIIHRSQWTGYKATYDDGGAPTTTNFSVNTPLLRIRSGAGLHIVRDQLGPVTNLEAQATFAYHYPLKNGKLSLGIRFGVYSQALDFERFRAKDKDDYLLAGAKESQIRPDMAAGIYYRTEKYYAGISVNHLVKPEFNYGIPSLSNALNNHVFATAGYNFDLNYSLVFTPSFLIKSDLNTWQFDVSGLFTYNQNVWGGLSFRQGDAAIIILGLNTLKDKNGTPLLRAGYAFDFIVKGKEAKNPTSNEIMLAYRLPDVKPTARTITRTPRFRH
jgi:type IX secretion system PorP/SprF family membrane protein